MSELAEAREENERLREAEYSQRVNRTYYEDEAKRLESQLAEARKENERLRAELDCIIGGVPEGQSE